MRIPRADREHVVPMCKEAKLVRAVLDALGAEQEVGQNDDDGPASQVLPRCPERVGEVSPPALRLEGHEIAEQAQGVRPAPRGRHVLLDPVREEDETDSMIAPDRGEGEDSGDLDRLLLLGARPRPERARGAHVDDEDDRELPLLAVLLHERAAGAGRRVPVDRPHVVAGRILAHLVEVHAAPLKA